MTDRDRAAARREIADAPAHRFLERRHDVLDAIVEDPATAKPPSTPSPACSGTSRIGSEAVMGNVVRPTHHRFAAPHQRNSTTSTAS